MIQLPRAVQTANEKGESDKKHWSEGFRWENVSGPGVVQDKILFLVLVSSSFLEMTIPVHTKNLTTYYASNAEVVEWVRHQWNKGEVEHGKALKRYATSVWKSFDWEAAYNRFYAEYQHCCTVGRMQPTKALEMLARCVTESGSATFYKWLSLSTSEPILASLMKRMWHDEVRHYKYFLRFFRYYALEERLGKIEIFTTMVRRSVQFKSEDAYIAFKYAWEAWHGEGSFKPRHYRHFMQEIRDRSRRLYPYEMLLRMLLQPLGLHGRLATLLARPLRLLAQRMVFMA